jgi:uncharacterized RDD family membrane protein YckC
MPASGSGLLHILLIIFILIGKYGKTVGKHALGIMVVNERNEIPGYKKSIVRHLGFLFLPFLFSLVLSGSQLIKRSKDGMTK